MQFRKGDIVSVRCVVKHNMDGSKERVFIDVKGSYETLWMEPEDVTLVRPFFEVGDAVRWGDRDGDKGEILGIAGEHAWIDLGNGDYCTRHFSAIQRDPMFAEVEEDAA